jgi:hypothetical protein
MIGNKIIHKAEYDTEIEMISSCDLICYMKADFKDYLRATPSVTDLVQVSYDVQLIKSQLFIDKSSIINDIK